MNSKKKGNRNERKLAHLFTKCTNWKFDRVPQSGGLRWKKADNISGDITCTEPGIQFPISIETKFYTNSVKNQVSIQRLLLETSNDLIKFWSQTVEDGKRSHKIPFLFVRYNNMASDTYYTFVPYIFFIKNKPNMNLEHGYITYKGRGIKFVIINSVDLFNSKYDKLWL